MCSLMFGGQFADYPDNNFPQSVNRSITQGQRGSLTGNDPTYLSCSPVTSTSASRSSSAAFFCMVFPIPSISLLTQEAQSRGVFVAKQTATHKDIILHWENAPDWHI